MNILGYRKDLSVKYKNQNISEMLNPHLKNWSYTDNLSGQIDDLQIVLEDVADKWAKSWFPKKTSSLSIEIVEKINGATLKTAIGSFEIDEITGRGPAMEVTLKASALPQKSTLKGTQKSKVWEKATPKTIFSDIAKRNNMKIFYQSSDTEKIDRVEQEHETDIAFLYRFAKERGLCLKITNLQIVVLDEEDLEKNKTKGSFKKDFKSTDDYKILTWEFTTNLTGVARSCTVKHQDTKKKKVIQGSFTPKNPPDVARTLVLKESISSTAEANRLAKKKLREANKDAETMTMVIHTTKHINAGDTYNVVGFGFMDGKYIVTQVVNNPSAKSVSLRKCLEGY